MEMNNPAMPDLREQVNIPDVMPVMAIEEGVIFPFMVFPFLIEGDKWGKMIDDTSLGNKIFAIFWRRTPGDNLDPNALGQTGTAVRIARMIRMPNGSIQLILQGLSRVHIQQITQTDPYPLARIETIKETAERTPELEGLMRAAQSLFGEVVALAPYLPNEVIATAAGIEDPGAVADFITSQINVQLEDRQSVLDTLDVSERLRKVVQLLQREKEILDIGQRAQQEMNKTQREYILRQQMEQIRRELGETNDQEAEAKELREQLQKANLPEEAAKEADRELDRLERMPPGTAEYTVSRTYLDWILNLPWNTYTEDNLDIPHAREVLDEDHYDLDQIKSRILEQLAVRKLNPDAKSPILCFVGPPGVGKPAWARVSRALLDGNSSVFHSVECGTKLKSAGTAGLILGPCPDGSSRACAGLARTTRCLCWMRWTSSR